jgi:hypothetical protein
MTASLAARWGNLPLAVHPIDVDIQLRDAAALLRITSPRFLPSCISSALPANSSPRLRELTYDSMQCRNTTWVGIHMLSESQDFSIHHLGPILASTKYLYTL